MSEFTQFLIIGLVTGVLYALIALGIIFIYRGSNIVNFGHGGFAALGAFAFVSVYDKGSRPYALALLAACVLTAAIAGVAQQIAIRQVVDRDPIDGAVITLGLLTILTFSIGIVWGATPRQMPQAFGSEGMTIGDLVVSYHQVMAVVIGVALFTAVGFFLQATRMGRAFRAISEKRQVAQLMGIPTPAYDLGVWMLGGAIAALAGILVAPTTGLTTTALTFIMVKALAAAMIGQLVSIPRTIVGALAIGVAESMAIWKLPDVTGIREILAFAVITGALLLAPRERVLA
ncbi:MAG: branched-chain amino acid ABC transporter permease [Acidimicrobiales bacterium]|nr:branched-chain amino acid ABC transporter permease [Acidimicrobiales bacterium]